jgi:hypothetical protein
MIKSKIETMIFQVQSGIIKLLEKFLKLAQKKILVYLFLKERTVRKHSRKRGMEISEITNITL